MSKVTAYAAASSLLSTDLVMAVVDPGGTPTTKNATLSVVATTVLTGAGFISLGTTPAVAGLVRVPYDGSFRTIIAGRNVINSADNIFLETASTNSYWGILDGLGIFRGDQVELRALGTGISCTISGNEVLKILAASVASAQPIVGDASVYGVHGKTTVTTANNFSVAAGDYIYGHIRLTSDTTGTVTFPRPAADTGSYTKFVGNASLNTKTITTGAGATVALLTSTGAEIEFDNTVGCILRSAALAYT